MLIVASLLRSRAWTPAGMQVAFGNREALPEVSPLAGRADRGSSSRIAPRSS